MIDPFHNYFVFCSYDFGDNRHTMTMESSFATKEEAVSEINRLSDDGLVFDRDEVLLEDRETTYFIMERSCKYEGSYYDQSWLPENQRERVTSIGIKED